MASSAPRQLLVTVFIWFGCFSDMNSHVGLLYISLATAEFILMRLLFTSMSSLESCLFKPAIHVLLRGFLMLAAMQTAMKLFSQSQIQFCYAALALEPTLRYKQNAQTASHSKRRKIQRLTQFERYV